MLRCGPSAASDHREAEPRVVGNGTCSTARGSVHSDRDVEINAMRKAYELKRVQDGVGRIMDLFSLIFPAYSTLVLIRWWAQLVSWHGFVCLQVPFGVFFVFIRWHRQYLLHLIGKNKPMGVVFQSVFWIVVTIILSFGSFSMKTELLQHRNFLTSYLPAFAFFTIVAYIPPDVFVPVCCLWNVIVWLLFHYAVGFVNIACMAYGFASSAFSYYIYKHLDYQAWNEFEATQALDKDRQFLQAMHDTLQGMLSSLFDASCTCDQSGAMLSSTPQLRDLLGVHEESNPGLHLRELAASTTEADRLSNFLEQICQSGSHRAEAIQASLQAAPRATSSREVKMFGILLPDRIDGPMDCRNKRIFIGLLGQGDSVSTLDACFPQATELREAVESAVHVGFDTMETFDLDDFAESNVGSLSYTRGHSSETRSNPSRVSKRHFHLQGLASLTDAAIQTEARFIDEHVPVMSIDVSVQTVQFFHECPRCSLPQPAQDFTREQAFFKDWKAKNPRAKKIVLNSSKRVLPDFVETPDATISAVLMQMLQTINARGRGCCRFHIIVARISHILARFRSQGCMADFSPYSDWQCHHCKAMNEDDKSDLEDDEGEPLCCSTCETAKIPLSNSGSDSGARADLENDHTCT